MTVLERFKIKYAGVVSRVDAHAHTVPCLDRRGFSLVELITVMAIVAALATMALPAYTGYLRTVKNGRCVSDLRTIDKAVTGYILDNNSLPTQLSDIGIAANQLDPWGRTFQYQIISSDHSNALEDQFFQPLNTDYDLYSLGEDGASALPYANSTSGDDIARYNNGMFIGLRNPNAS